MRLCDRSGTIFPVVYLLPIPGSPQLKRKIFAFLEAGNVYARIGSLFMPVEIA